MCRDRRIGAVGGSVLGGADWSAREAPPSGSSAGAMRPVSIRVGSGSESSSSWDLAGAGVHVGRLGEGSLRGDVQGVVLLEACPVSSPVVHPEPGAEEADGELERRPVASGAEEAVSRRDREMEESGMTGCSARGS